MHRNSGQILIQTLVTSAIGVVIILVLTNLALFASNQSSLALRREQSFQAAEAGLEYYRWHLAHAPGDFTNGTGQPGPYTIPFNDKSGIHIGDSILTITAPPSGSTLVTIKSKGQLLNDPVSARTIEAKMGIPSLASYAAVANDKMNFGPGTEVFGPIHSNDGIRFDGIAHNIVSSSKTDYDDPDHTGGNEFGVHTHVPPVDPLPPASVPNRPDVFQAGRIFPVPAIDFTGLIANLADIKASAQSNGLYFAPSGNFGYEAVFLPNDTIRVSRVTALLAAPSGCNNDANEAGWGTWSITATTTLGTYPLPANGLIFFEDSVWISGQINGAKLTVGSARFPEGHGTATNIIINNDLLYTAYDGTDVIGLIAQNNITIGLKSDTDLRIDAALVAKTGRVGRYYYRQPGSQQYCTSDALKNSITSNGMIATNKRYGFSWTCSGVYCSGYAIRNLVYDANLLFGPPPSFPLTGTEYQIIDWRELK